MHLPLLFDATMTTMWAVVPWVVEDTAGIRVRGKKLKKKLKEKAVGTPPTTSGGEEGGEEGGEDKAAAEAPKPNEGGEDEAAAEAPKAADAPSVEDPPPRR